MFKFNTNKKEGKEEFSEKKIKELEMEISLMKDAYFQLKKITTNLEKSENILRKSQSIARVGCWEYDISTKKITWSDEMYVLYEKDKSLGPPSFEEEAKYYLPEESKRLHEMATTAINEGKVFEDYEITVNLPSGKTAFFNASMYPVKDAKGNVAKLSGIIHDITGYKKMNESVKLSEEKFRSIFNGAKDGILIADLESKKFLLGNSAISEMLGYSQEELSSLGVMDIHPEKDIPFVVDQFERQSKGEFSMSKDLPVKRKDGNVFYADVNAAPVKIGGKSYLLGFFHDTTQRRKIEVDFKNKYDEMERLYNATINRELKMIELKKEIEVLKAKLENK